MFVPMVLIAGLGYFVAVVWALWHYFQMAEAWWQYLLLVIFALVLPFLYAIGCWLEYGFWNTYTLLVAISSVCSLGVRWAQKIPDRFLVAKKSESCEDQQITARPDLDSWSLQICSRFPEISIDALLDMYIKEFDFRIQKYTNELDSSINIRTKIHLIENSLFYNPEYIDSKELAQYLANMKMALPMADVLHKGDPTKYIPLADPHQS